MKYGINTNIMPGGKVISSGLEDYKTTLHTFFVNNTFISKTKPRSDSK